MLYQGNSAELRAAAKRLLDLAERREGHAEQRTLMASLGASRRIAAVRPLAHAWACAAQTGRPQPRWFSRAATPTDEALETAEHALRALAALWSTASPRQVNQLDQELRGGGYASPTAAAASWQLSAASVLDGVSESADLRSVGLGILACHPSGHVREAAVRALARAPLETALPILLVRANDWVRQIRTVAYARLLLLDDTDVECLAPQLALVEQLASQARREPGAVEHLLNLLRGAPGLDALRGCWVSSSPSLRRAAVYFSWDAAPDRGPVVAAAVGSTDPVLRRWSVEKLAAGSDAGGRDTLRALARDPDPTVAEAALDALDAHIEPADRALLEALRCAPSPRVQLTARYLLDKHFGTTDHRSVYLARLGAGDDRSRIAAAIGLSATGKATDYQRLLAHRIGAGSRARQRLLRAAASLDDDGSRAAMLEDLGHAHPGVSKAARNLLIDRVNDTDRDALARLQESHHAHVRRNTLIVSAGLGHWAALAAIVRGHRDVDADHVRTAQRLFGKWLQRHLHGMYRAPDPSAEQQGKVRAEMAACGAALHPTARTNIERALAGARGPAAR